MRLWYDSNKQLTDHDLKQINQEYLASLSPGPLLQKSRRQSRKKPKKRRWRPPMSGKQRRQISPVKISASPANSQAQRE
jgi:hypothetical protein